MTIIPRPVANGEDVVTKRADELTADDYGLIASHPGNRGWLRAAQSWEGGTFVNTTTGCAVYPNDAEFHLWGKGDPPRCLRHQGALLKNCRSCAWERRQAKETTE